MSWWESSAKYSTAQKVFVEQINNSFLVSNTIHPRPLSHLLGGVTTYPFDQTFKHMHTSSQVSEGELER